MATSAQIGDSQPVARNAVVSSLPISVVTQAEIEDIDAAVNDALVSGKRLGGTYVITLTAGGTDIVVAQGVDADSEWHRISDAGATPIVPA